MKCVEALVCHCIAIQMKFVLLMVVVSDVLLMVLWFLDALKSKYFVEGAIKNLRCIYIFILSQRLIINKTKFR